MDIWLVSLCESKIENMVAESIKKFLKACQSNCGCNVVEPEEKQEPSLRKSSPHQAPSVIPEILEFWIQLLNQNGFSGKICTLLVPRLFLIMNSQLKI